MAKQTINIGAAPNDGTGTPLRTSFDYCNQNFTELYTATGPSGNNIVVPGSATITGDLTAARLIVTGGTIPANGLWLPTTNTLEFAANSLAQYRIAPLGVFSWYDGAGGTRMTLNSTGLGVGRSPSYKLDIAGVGNFDQLRVSATSATQIALVNATNGLTYSLYNANTASNGFNGFGIFDGSSYVMRIDSSGNVGVGVTLSAWGGAFKAIEFGTLGSISSTGVATRFSGNSYNNGTNFIYKASSVAACLYEMNSGEHRFSTAPSGTAGNAITFTQAMTLDASGRLLVGPTSANASGGILQLSSGITFPATQVASSDANTLDDYEEGTFTPAIAGTTTAGTGTYTSQFGRYTKIGNRVFCDIYIVWTAHTGTGNMEITSLPFTVDASGIVSSVSIGQANNIALTAGNILSGQTLTSSTSIRLRQMPVGGGASSPVPIDTAADILLSVCYTV